MIAENQIRELLANYLRGDISLDQFEDWLVERSWNMHRDSDGAAQKLAAAIELRLAEYSSGHLSDNDLRKELVPIVTSYNPKLDVDWASESVPTSSSCNSTVQVVPPFALSWPVGGLVLKELLSH